MPYRQFDALNVLVTGAGGFLGGQVARQLGAAGHNVMALFRSVLPADLVGVTGVTLLRGDLMRPGTLPQNFEAVVHCAAEIPARTANPEILYATNVIAMANLLSCASVVGARRIVFCSSMSVYGSIEADIVTVETPPNKPDAYGQSKAEAERLLSDWCRGSDDRRAVSIRLPGVVGRGSHSNFLSGLLGGILDGRTVSVLNPDAPFNNIVWARDFAMFVGKLLDEMPQGHTVSTIAGTEPLSIRAIVSLLFHESSRVERVDYANGGKPFLIDPAPGQALGFAAPPVAESLRNWVSECLYQADPTLPCLRPDP